MEFDFIYRGHERSLVLIPGWGFCPDIFSSLNISYNYILPKRAVYGDISADLHDFLLSRDIAEVSVLGWSMGVCVVLDFCAEFSDMIKTLYAVSWKKAFDNEDILSQLKAIELNRIAALKQFYRRCFCGQRADYRWFSSTLEETSIRQWAMPELRKGLMYLKGKTCDLSLCSGSQLRIFHGEKDVIAPLSEIFKHFPRVPIDVIPNTGHLPFLSSEFERRFCVP